MKGVVFFSLCLALVFPIYQVQRGDVFDVCGLKDVYFVKTEKGKTYCEKQDKKTFSIQDMNNQQGVVLIFESNLEDLIHGLKIKIFKKENIENLNIYYGYTPIYSDAIFIDDKQANVQIVEREGEMIVGFPIILSGF